MEKPPDLIIPIRMDPSKAIAALAKVGADGKKAGDEVAHGAAKAESGLKAAATAASDFGRQAVAVHSTQLAMTAISGAVSAMSAEFKAAVGYITNIAKEFVELRQTMQQVAALKGAPNTNQFTVEEAKKAAATSLTPQEWRRFQEQFQSYGGAYIEGEQSRFQRKETDAEFQKRAAEFAQKNKMTLAQAEEQLERMTVTDTEAAEKYQAQIAEFAKARGIPPKEIAQLGGALLQFEKGPTTPEEMMAKLGKVYKTLERAPTPVSELMPAMSCVMAQGASAEEASEMLAIMSEAMPHEEKTGVVDTLKAITNETLEGRGEALGQKEGMTPLEKVKAAVEAVKARVAKGENLDQIIHKIAPDLREAKGIKGFLSRGFEANGFERIEGYQAEVPADFVQQSIADYEKTNPGGYAKAAAQESLAEAMAGARNAELQTLQMEAEARMTDRKDFEELHLGESAIRGATGKLAGVETRQQRINAEMLEDVGRRTAAAGIETNYNPNTALGRANIATESAAQDPLTINERLLEILEKIETNTKKEGKSEQKPGGGKPLAAPPPGRAGARQ
jgi:hypothetical protein